MRPGSFLTVPLLLGTLAAGASAQAQEAAPVLEARVWLDRGEEPVLQRGDAVRVYYRASDDAWAAIFRIDTDGVISMVFPQHPGAIEPMRGGRDYRLLLPESPTWRVTDDPGSGYWFIVASSEPLDFSAFPFDPDAGWDLGAVGGVVYEDPYVAIDDYVALLVPDWEVAPYALDFITYHVGTTYSYPRFLCYDCHTPRPYAVWNPYSAVCSSFRVVIWDDPYFYPAYRYAGTAVVVARPARALPRYEVVTRTPGDIGVRPLVRTRAAPERRAVQFKESPGVDPASRIPTRRASPATGGRPLSGAATSRGVQEDPRGAAGRPVLQRRPSARLPARTPPAASSRPQARGTPSVRPERAGPGARPARPEPSEASPRGPASGPSERRGPEPRAGSPTRGDADRAGPPPSRPSARPPAPGTRPDAAPSRPAPSRPTARPPARSVPASASPSRPRPSSTRPSGASRPTTGRASPPSRPATRPSPPQREPASRPTVRPRGRPRGN